MAHTVCTTLGTGSCSWLAFVSDKQQFQPTTKKTPSYMAMGRKHAPPHSIRLHGVVLIKYTDNFTLLPATHCTLATSHDGAFSLLCILFLAKSLINRDY